MRKLLFTLIMFPVLVFGQTQNYIKTTNYREPGATNPVENITYFDGLGRPIQQIAHKQSAAGNDIITHMEYDGLGRQVKDYLPYSKWYGTPSLNYGGSAQVETMAYYSTYDPSVTGNPTFDQTSNPYSEKLFEASPLNRVLKQAAPGNPWVMGGGHEIKFEYLSNVKNEVKLYKATSDFANNTITLINGAGTTYYPIGELYKTITKDENWANNTLSNTTEEFKDKEGRVILKRTYALYVNGRQVVPEAAHDTYYVYDQYGNLTFVIPPKAAAVTSTTIMNELVYQYKYDHKNRLIEKKLPGKQWEFMVYDKLDRVVATGPAFSPFSDIVSPNNIGWTITKYDFLSRPILTGWLPSSTVGSSDRASLQSLYNAVGLPVNETKSATDQINGTGSFATRYTNTAIPSSYATAYHVLSVSYYDDYNTNLTFTPAISYTISSMTPQPVYYNNTSGTLPKGLPTVSWVRVPETSTLFNAEKSYTLYDVKGRAVRTFLNNHLGGYTQVDNQLELMTGRINYTETRHRRISTSSEIYLKDSYTYTAQDRLLTHVHQIGASGTPQLMNKNTYDNLGQLIQKNVGGTDVTTYAGLQKVDYSYNIRGWLTGINDVADLKAATENDLFAFGINYNKPITHNEGGTIVPLYNGNIAETNWRTANDYVHRRYGYAYDAMNRLKNAVYQKPSGANPVPNSYNETVNYDFNGNIMRLWRTGELDSDVIAIDTDDLDYAYLNGGNKLASVSDYIGSPAGFPSVYEGYTYDNNGNMTSNSGRSIINISYNHLNLPMEILFNSGGTKKINYFYNAVGKKVRKVVTDAGLIWTTHYLDSFQYTDTRLDFISTAEGFVKNVGIRNNNVYNYVFQYKDHLGNIRVNYTKDPDSGLLTIMNENNYYPFGLKHNNYNGTEYEYVENGDYGYYYPVLAPVTDPDSSTAASKYRFQGQEHQEELGLNWDSFKWRNYDPAMARFMNIDPLAEKYSYQSPYNFSENRVIDARELEGLEAVLVHGTWAKREDKKLYSLDKANYKGGSTWQQMFSQRVALATGWNSKSTFEYTWSGENNSKARKTGGEMLAKTLMSKDNPFAEGKHATLIGHSHGGNVNKVAKNILEQNGWVVDIINISTPQRKDTQQNLTGNGINLNFYSEGDMIQWIGAGDNCREYNVPETGARIDPYSWSYEILVSDDPFNWIINSGGHSFHQNYRAQQQMLKHIEEEVEKNREKQKHSYNGK